VEVGRLRLLIDAGPDFRYQAIRENIGRIDAVLITHHHFDHVAGLDDLRPFLFQNRAPIPCYAPESTVRVLRNTFGYIFKDAHYPGVPRLSLRAVDGPFEVTSRDGDEASVTVVPVPALHGELDVLGYRIGKFAYVTDVSSIQDASLPLLEDLDILVLDALRHEPHPMHLSIDEAVDVARRIGATNTYFIHMTHSVLHEEVDAQLPDGIALGYDGLTVRARSR